MTSRLTYPSFGARLRIVGDALDPENITSRTGLVPTRFARRGDRIERPRAMLTENRGWWEVSSRVPSERPLTEHIDDVLSLVGPAAASIASLASVFEVWLSLAVFAEAVPELGLSVQQVRAAASLGAAIDIDLILVDHSDGVS